jgi:uncharacterized protein (TIGR03435 family)
MTGAKKTAIVFTLLFLLIAAGVAVKLIYFPSVKNAWFQFNAQNLREIPHGLVIVRETHFPLSLHKGVMQIMVKEERHALGRNVTLQQLMATAYDHNPGRVAVPPEAPTNNYDFLVTVAGKPEEALQSAIRKKFGYVAHEGMAETAVLALKAADEHPSGLTVSADDEKQNIMFGNRKIDFKHTSLKKLAIYLEWMLSTPVVDQSGLTNFYDFSLNWNEQTLRLAQKGMMPRAAADKLVAAWGLSLQPETSSIPMLVVEKVND